MATATMHVKHPLCMQEHAPAWSHNGTNINMHSKLGVSPATTITKYLHTEQRAD